jgi:hypothetical protein
MLSSDLLGNKKSFITRLYWKIVTMFGIRVYQGGVGRV